MSQPDYLPLVQGLERIYEFVVALAFGEAVMEFIKKPDKQDVNAVSNPHWSSSPQAIAFFATAVGFFHGMNRYLELTYAPAEGRHDLRLLLDVVVFLLEGCMLFMAAACLTEKNLRCFAVLCALFVFDAAWSGITAWLGGSSVLWGWCVQNVVCSVLIILLLRFLRPRAEMCAAVLCAIVVVGKMSIDYWLNWHTFYFGS